VVRQRHFIAVAAFLIGGAVLLLAVGCAGARSESPKEQGHTNATKQGHTEATNEQGRSPEATESEAARCEGTRTYDYQKKDAFITNDLPGCPKGGLLLGTDKRDLLNGKGGEDEVRGLGGPDNLYGGSGNDILYGGPDGEYEMLGGTGGDVLHGGDGDDALESARKSASNEGDDVLHGGDGVDYLSGIDEGKDVLYGGDGNDMLFADGGGAQDKLYCGAGRDRYYSDKNDYVASSCEVKQQPGGAPAD
jgi:hypothetical protein